MNNGWTQNVLAEARTHGAVMQVVDSVYEAGAAPVRQHAGVMLRLKLWPKKTDVRVWLGQDTEPQLCGELMLLPPKIDTGALGPNHPAAMRCLSFTFDQSWLEDFIGSDLQNLIDDPQVGLNFRDNYIEQAMWRIYPELLKPDTLSATVLESCSQAIAVDLSRRFAAVATAEHAPPRSTYYDQRIRLVEDMIAGDWQDFRPAAALADELGIGVSYLRALYRQATGRNLEDALEEVYIRHAKELLSDSRVPVKVIAFDMGYTTHSAFSAAFKKFVGKSPRQFRNDCRQS